MGVTATSALLAIFAWTLLSIYAERGEEGVVTEAPAATPAPAAKTEKAKPKKAKPKLTRAQRRDRAAAVATLGGLGYRPVTLKTYAPDNVLRVLIGKGEGGKRAFFFAGAKYLGNDAADDSAAVEVVRAGNRSVALSYRLFAEDDRPCCPSGAEGPRAVPLGRQEARPADGDPAVRAAPRAVRLGGGRSGVCISTQPLPSGSTKDADVPHGSSRTSPVNSTPRSRSASKAARASGVSSTSPVTLPGGIWSNQVTSAIVACEPGGASSTQRMPSPNGPSKRSSKPSTST